MSATEWDSQDWPPPQNSWKWGFTPVFSKFTKSHPCHDTQVEKTPPNHSFLGVNTNQSTRRKTVHQGITNHNFSFHLLLLLTLPSVPQHRQNEHLWPRAPAQPSDTSGAPCKANIPTTHHSYHINYLSAGITTKTAASGKFGKVFIKYARSNYENIVDKCQDKFEYSKADPLTPQHQENLW